MADEGGMVRTGGPRITEPDEWRLIDQRGHRRRYARGQVLFHEGERPDHVVVLTSGRVKISVVTGTGREVVLAVKEPGQLIGELSVIDGRPRSATATALTDVEAVAMPASGFDELLEAHPRLALRMLRSLAVQLRQAGRLTADRDDGDTVTRVARRLSELGDRLVEHGAGTTQLSITQDDLAAWVGATREATSRALGTLREGGLVATGRGTITILDLPALHRRAVADVTAPP